MRKNLEILPQAEPKSGAVATDAGTEGTVPAIAGKTIAPLAVGLGALMLDGCGGGASGRNSGGGVPPPVGLTTTQASRFLAQASIGYAKSDITALAASSYEAWLDTQFTMARPQKFWDFLTINGYDAAANKNTIAGFDAMMWAQLMGSADILRQRVGLALLSIWVVGVRGLNSSWRSFVMAAYLDGLWDNAFGNYRDIMESVSTSVAMGHFLTFIGSVKANPATGSIPDENYARELMQLFTIGLYQLNRDGSLVMSGGAPVPTYTQADVSQGARVWTGYTYANKDGTTPARMRLPMVIDATSHETGATSLLGGAISIPAGTDGATARKIALDALFQHASLPPFICKQLIQRLVTSNPSPAYINRVATAFVDNGSGVRGDMKAVIRAILTDSEARDDTQVSSTTFGKLREPIVRLTQWARAFNVTSPTKLWPFGDTESSASGLGESPARSPSVFNWFRPGYVPPGTPMAAANLATPEFQIVNEPSLVAYVNYMQQVIASGVGEARPDYSSLTPLATDSQALLNELNLVLAANQISAATIAQMKAALDTISIATTAGLNNRIHIAILLVMVSPEYLVLR